MSVCDTDELLFKDRQETNSCVKPSEHRHIAMVEDVVGQVRNFIADLLIKGEGSWGYGDDQWWLPRRWVVFCRAAGYCFTGKSRDRLRAGSGSSQPLAAYAGL